MLTKHEFWHFSAINFSLKLKKSILWHNHYRMLSGHIICAGTTFCFPFSGLESWVMLWVICLVSCQKCTICSLVFAQILKQWSISWLVRAADSEQIFHTICTVYSWPCSQIGSYLESIKIHFHRNFQADKIHYINCMHMYIHINITIDQVLCASLQLYQPNNVSKATFIHVKIFLDVYFVLLWCFFLIIHPRFQKYLHHAWTCQPNANWANAT